MVFGQFKFSWRNRNAVIGTDSLQGFITNFFYEEHFLYIYKQITILIPSLYYGKIQGL